MSSFETRTSTSRARRPGAAGSILGTRPRGPHRLALPGDRSDSRVSEETSPGEWGAGVPHASLGWPGPLTPAGRATGGGGGLAVARRRLCRDPAWLAPPLSTEAIQRGSRPARGPARLPGVWTRSGDRVGSGVECGSVSPQVRRPRLPALASPCWAAWGRGASVPSTPAGLWTPGPGAREPGGQQQPPGSVASKWPGWDPQPLPPETEAQESMAPELVLRDRASEEAKGGTK